MTEKRDRLLLLVCTKKLKAGEKVSIVTNWEVERVRSRAKLYWMVGRSVHKLLRTWLGLLIIVLKREQSAGAAI